MILTLTAAQKAINDVILTMEALQRDCIKAEKLADARHDMIRDMSGKLVQANTDMAVMRLAQERRARKIDDLTKQISELRDTHATIVVAAFKDSTETAEYERILAEQGWAIDTMVCLWRDAHGEGQNHIPPSLTQLLQWSAEMLSGPAPDRDGTLPYDAVIRDQAKRIKDQAATIIVLRDRLERARHG